MREILSLRFLIRWATQEQSSMKGDEERRGADKGSQGFSRKEMYERQDIESELPAEYTQMKREVDEDGFREMEMNAKRQRYSDTNNNYHADTQVAEAIYGYTQQVLDNSNAPEVQQQQQQQPNLKVGGIIPANVLSSLKTLKDPKSLSPSSSSTAPSPSSTQQKTTRPAGLGNLASYGSDSEDEEDD